MSIADQALFLLDIPPSIDKRKKLENFSDLALTVGASLRTAIEEAEPAPAQAEAPPASYSVASRMNRANYEDQAKAEALTRALRQIRASHAAKLIQTRTTGQS
ncbi:MAG: hypothetical protein ACXVB9_21915 [Bdellovibrionota bacterium]